MHRVLMSVAFLTIFSTISCQADRVSGEGDEQEKECEGLSTCDGEGKSCDGNTLVTCGKNSDGCIIKVDSEDCGQTANTICASSGDSFACVTEDPCEGVSNCSSPSTSCLGDVFISCAANAQGCLVETRTDCAEDGGECHNVAGEASCFVDLCDSVQTPCDFVESNCNGDLVEDCRMNANACLELVVTDCSASGLSCGYDSGDAVCMDLCEGVEQCSRAGQYCENGEVVTCYENSAGCLVVSTRNDCDNGRVCQESGNQASCVGPCTLVDTCGVELECQDNSLVTCALDSNNCLVATDTQNCSTGGLSCGAFGDSHACVLSELREPNVAIPNAYDVVNDVMTISGSCLIAELAVEVTIYHDLREELQVELKSPNDVVTVVLHRGNNAASSGSEDLIGTYPTTLTPEGDLSDFTGVNASGDWTLYVNDVRSMYDMTGSLHSWGLSMTCGG